MRHSRPRPQSANTCLLVLRSPGSGSCCGQPTAQFLLIACPEPLPALCNVSASHQHMEGMKELTLVRQRDGREDKGSGDERDELRKIVNKCAK